ncbi:hypothetical protein NITHO_1550012 [Nitrolancea hollandica Lb]|uniref:Uncharacterized protein n=1 Tax=Nitrolancea hollandica Lb TaxID=1129897 RepID=I4EDL1_9BACT|nr:hypothetical protein NITHO_1550012 [Nitrolancea hollandica Lb]
MGDGDGVGVGVDDGDGVAGEGSVCVDGLSVQPDSTPASSTMRRSLFMNNPFGRTPLRSPARNTILQRPHTRPLTASHMRSGERKHTTGNDVKTRPIEGPANEMANAGLLPMPRGHGG